MNKPFLSQIQQKHADLSIRNGQLVTPAGIVQADWPWLLARLPILAPAAGPLPKNWT
ncbi:hypothetical protein [Alishewanella longhuensis]